MTHFYSVETVGADWCFVCDDIHTDTKAEAWDQARRNVATYPEYCTLVYAGEYGTITPEGAFNARLTLVWTSRPTPDDDPSLPRSTRDDYYEG